MALTDGPVATTTQIGVFNTGTVTIPFTVPAGNDRLLLLKISYRNNSSQTITGVTYGGTAMSNNDQDGTPSAMNVANGTDVHTYIWRLIAPVVGTNNIVVTFSAAGLFYIAIAEAWDGAHQTTALGVVATATGSSTGTTATLTVDAGSASGEVVTDAAADRTTFADEMTLVAGSGQTEIDETLVSNVLRMGGSYEAGDTTVTMSWLATHPSSRDHDWAIVAISLKPSSTLSAALSASTSIAEIGVVPWRKAPSIGFQSSAAVLAKENMQLNFELAGMMPKVVVGTIKGDTVVYDDWLTQPSVAPAGRMLVSSAPTPMTPNSNSLAVTTQDTFALYPFPYSFEPHLTPFPQLAHSYSDNAGLTPVYYPSAIDFGEMTEIRYLEVYAQNMTTSDGIRVAFTWDDTWQWFNGEAQSENWCMWAFDDNFGRILRLAVSINDADDGDPVGPTIVRIKGWARARPDVREGTQPTRQEPEVS